MIFWSKREDELKRKLVDRLLFTVYLQEGNLLSELNHVNKLANKAGATNIFWRREWVEETDCSDKIEKMVFYHRTLETDAEYKKRILDLKQKDLQEFVDTVCRFYGACREKAALKTLMTSVKKEYPFILSDWQEEQVNKFFSEKSAQELIDEAYSRGKEDGEKGLRELQNKIKSLAK